MKKYQSLSVDDIHTKMFHTTTMAQENIELLSFEPFIDTADAVSAISACQEGRITTSLQQFLTKKLKKRVENEDDSGLMKLVEERELRFV